MSLSHCPGGDDDRATRRTSARWAAGGLALAASPTFALMALLTGASGGGPDQMLCTSGQEPAIGGMATMYVLMSGFHLTPWLKLMHNSERRSA